MDKLSAAEAIPAGSAVEIDPTSGNVRLARPSERPPKVGERVIVTFNDPDSRATFGHTVEGVLSEDHRDHLLVTLRGGYTVRASHADVRLAP